MRIPYKPTTHTPFSAESLVTKNPIKTRPKSASSMKFHEYRKMVEKDEGNILILPLIDKSIMSILRHGETYKVVFYHQRNGEWHHTWAKTHPQLDKVLSALRGDMDSLLYFRALNKEP